MFQVRTKMGDGLDTYAFVSIIRYVDKFPTKMSFTVENTMFCGSLDNFARFFPLVAFENK